MGLHADSVGGGGCDGHCGLAQPAGNRAGEPFRTLEEARKKIALRETSGPKSFRISEQEEI